MYMFIVYIQIYSVVKRERDHRLSVYTVEKKSENSISAPKYLNSINFTISTLKDGSDDANIYHQNIYK